MRKRFLIFYFFFCVSIYARNAYAQEKERLIDTWEREMLAKLPKKGWLYKSLKHNYYGGSANIHVEWRILLFKGVTYYFTSRAKENCYQDQGNFAVFDIDRNYVFVYQRHHNSINKSFEGIYFKCQATGFYYLSLDYSYCKTIVIIGMKHE